LHENQISSAWEERPNLYAIVLPTVVAKFSDEEFDTAAVHQVMRYYGRWDFDNHEGAVSLKRLKTLLDVDQLRTCAGSALAQPYLHGKFVIRVGCRMPNAAPLR
jgi:hypothetical protein